MSLHKTTKWLRGLCDEAYSILRGTLLVCCVMLFCAFFYLIDIGQVTTHTYYVYLCALELARAPAGLILIAFIGSLCLDERAKK